MSVYSVSNSAMPSLIGYGGLAISALSALSLIAGGPAIIDLPGDNVIDFAAAGLTFVVAGAILKSREPVAAWLGAAMLTVMIMYAGLRVDTNQASNMLEAAKNAATSGAQAATQAVASASTTGNYQQQLANFGNNPRQPSVNPTWVAVRPLTKAESNECDQIPAKAWVNTAAGQRNCTPATDGNRYVWRWQ
ncbi:hypothetical protein [Thiolinea disciformis]|uniref:hypothetical protein n=1 Tax=Thiolinea disciformis TaxID=125614 RepID=UPI0003710CFF|nr:hypothetical protein [Thiolinea disciformis]